MNTSITNRELDSAWDVFDVDNTGFLQIQKDDEADLFSSDYEAVGYVIWRAREGDPRSLAALEKVGIRLE
jgi:formaldehyde-activating enzyme involved in methanogenesis